MQPNPIRRVVLCLAGAGLVLLLLLAAVLAVRSLAAAAGERWVPHQLDRAQTRQARWLRARLERLELVAEIVDHEISTLDPEGLGEDEEGEGEGEGALLRALLDQRRRRSALDELGFFHSQGAVLSGSGEALDGALRAEIRRLAEAIRGGADAAATRSGLYPADGRLFLVALRNRGADGEGAPGGVLALVEVVHGERSGLIGAPGEADLAYVVEARPAPRVAASNLSPAVEGELVVALLGTGEWSMLSQRGRRFELELGGGPRAILSSPIADLEGRNTVLAITGVSAQPLALGAGSELFWLLLGGVLVAASVALLLWWATAPAEGLSNVGALNALAEGVEEVRAGTARALAVEVPSEAPGALRRLVVAVAALVADRAREDDDPSAREASSSEPRQGVETQLGRRLVADTALVNLLAIDLKTLAGPETLADPDRVLARTVRDVERVRTLVEQHGGRLESWQGHRLLASFEQERSGAALDAAMTVMDALAIVDGFDEPRPPAIAATLGQVLIGFPTGSEPGSQVFLGLPLQQLDDLLREAVPGDLLIARPLAEQVGDELAERGLEIREQRALYTVQSIYSIGAPAKE